jgi:hypothetical protein
MPKSFFHEHDHHEIEHANDWDQSVSADEGHCFVCDVDLSTYHFSTVQPIRLDVQATVSGKEQEYLTEQTDHFDSFQHRGPPNFI